MTAGTIGQPLAHTPPLMLLTALGSWHWCPHFATEDTMWGACLESGHQGVRGQSPKALQVHSPYCVPAPVRASLHPPAGASQEPGAARAVPWPLMADSSVPWLEWSSSHRGARDRASFTLCQPLASSSALQGRPGLDLLTPTCVPGHSVRDQGIALKAVGNGA